MDLIGTKAWLWINGICLIVIGAISLVPAIASGIDVTILSIIKIAVAMITIIVAFRETNMEMINGKIWLLFVGVILLTMGVFPFFPAFMMAFPTFVDFLNAMKVVLGVVTFILIIMDWSKYGP
ncbi:MAG: hypothetical protein ACW98Y_08040 [Candidatus Thorarchaeota archaeon]|jgi:hypothetical protein